MATLTYQDLQFQQEDEKIKVSFLRQFYTHLDKGQVEKIAPYQLEGNAITFAGINEARAQKRFTYLLEDAFKHLRNRISDKPTFYIHRHSGIPLVGTNYFGIIDRGTNVLEVKPMSSCNISCVFCSVDEGPTSRRKMDYVIEKDYLVQEFRKVVAQKDIQDIDAHINAQGEPTLYKDLVPLVRDIMATPGVVMSSIDTNGLLLTRQLIDDLAEAGLKRINLSLHALDPEIARKMAGLPYNVKKVTESARYAATKMDLVITPVWLPGYNDQELPKLARFAEEIGAGKDCPPIAIQNFLPYKRGRNPISPVPLESFFRRMKELEQEHHVTLLHNKGFGIRMSPEIKKPFRKNEVVEAEIQLPGRIPGEKLAVARDRVISVPECRKESGMVRLRIKRTKHNVFIGELM